MIYPATLCFPHKQQCHQVILSWVPVQSNLLRKSLSFFSSPICWVDRRWGKSPCRNHPHRGNLQREKPAVWGEMDCTQAAVHPTWVRLPLLLKTVSEKTLLWRLTWEVVQRRSTVWYSIPSTPQQPSSNVVFWLGAGPLYEMALMKMVFAMDQKDGWQKNRLIERDGHTQVYWKTVWRLLLLVSGFVELSVSCHKKW